MKAKTKRLVSKCGLCGHKFETADALAIHMTKAHTGLTPAPLMDLLEKHQSASEVLRAAAEWLEQSTGKDGALTPEAAEQVRREDARIQLILRLLAAKKIDRAFTVDQTCQSLFTLLRRKLQGEYRDKIGPLELMSLVERMQKLQHDELLFLKEIAQLGEVNLGGLLEQLTRAVSTGSATRLGHRPTTATGAMIPSRPDQRERLRRSARLVLMEVQSESMADAAAIDADVSEIPE